MNIAIMVPSLHSGGAERAAGLLSKNLSHFYNIFLFLVDVENIAYDYDGTIVDIGKGWPFYGDEIIRAKKKYSIDVSISFMEEMNVWNIRTRINEKIIISVRCAHKSMIPPYACDELLINRWYKYADAIVACSYGVEYELVNHFGIKRPIHTIYNYINKGKIVQSADELFDDRVKGFISDASFYINIGRLHIQKRQKELIDQFSSYVKRNMVNEKLLILGSGNLREELNEYISSKAMDNYIMIFPYDSNPFKYIKKARALICTSRCEGLPNVILESLALGVPVIASDCMAGPRELIDDNLDYAEPFKKIKICKRGILLPFDLNEDAECLSKAIIELKNNDLYKKMAGNGKRYIDKYDLAYINSKWKAVIDEQNDEIKCNYHDEDKAILDNAKEIIIYGAGKAAKQYYEKLHNCYNILAFAVSNKEDSGGYLYNLPVKVIDDFLDDKNDIAIIVGTNWIYANEVVDNLNRLGFSKIALPWF